MRNDSLFLVFILALTTGVLAVSGAADRVLGNDVFVQKEQEKLKVMVAESSLREKLLQEQMYDFQQSVAAELGQQKVDTWAKASVLAVSRAPASIEKFEGSGILLAQGKNHFVDKNYLKAANTFSSLLEKYPASPYSIESRFLYAESLFLSGRTDQCVEEIELMMTQYPEHPMTGYLMLRLSQIFQGRNRKPEAVEVLRMIERNFSSETELQIQAKSLEKAMLSL